MKIVYLKPKSGFITELRSDTLWGLLCWGIRNVFGNPTLEKVLESFNENKPEFLISSAFPYKKYENEIIQYFPKPILPVKPYEIDSTSIDKKNKLQKSIDEKKNKKKVLIGFNHFQKLINKQISLENAIIETEHIKLESLSVTHNTIDRLKGATLKKDGVGQLFHKDEFFLANNSENEFDETGLFFLINGNSEKVEAALRWLGHVGFGGDRNTGKGHFEVHVSDFYIQEPNDYNAITTLSLYHPSKNKNELSKYKFSPLFNYQLEKRQGYMSFMKYKNFDKPETIMFREGSVFPAILDLVHFGENKVLKEKNSEAGVFHPVYQFGYGFMIKMKI